MFNFEDVKRLVDCACRALKAENRYLEGCFKERGWLVTENGAGICDNPNERYYQFVIWRELMNSFSWRSRTERDGYDLAFYEGAKSEPIAYAEIKCWWSWNGKSEVRGIRRDLTGKLGIAEHPGVMLILTCHLAEDAKENFDWLAEKLDVDRSAMVTKSFPVSSGPGDEDDWEFAVVGIPVKPAAS
ncbi:MAG TPA: hypothetical protein VKF41_05920 [Bryobacteraceae bacterium]|nr:hypothetical protein [Bryobacteraceae bacterium]